MNTKNSSPFKRFQSAGSSSFLAATCAIGVIFGAQSAQAIDLHYGEDFFMQGMDSQYVQSIGQNLHRSKYGFADFSWTMIHPSDEFADEEILEGDSVFLKNDQGEYITEKFNGEESMFTSFRTPHAFATEKATRFTIEKDGSNGVWVFQSEASGNRFTAIAGEHTIPNTHFILEKKEGSYNADCHDHEYGLLLARVVREATNTIRQYDISEDDIQSTGYFDTVESMCTNTHAWQQIEENAQIRVETLDGNDIRLLLTKADDEAYIAFPGITTESILDILDSGFSLWSGADSADVHTMFYQQWQAIDHNVKNWLNNSKQANITKVNISGHSRGGVLAQYMLADLGDTTLANKDVDLALFGSPNAGNEAFTEAWCNKSSLKNADFYVTRFKYNGFDIDRRKHYDDLVTWRDFDNNIVGVAGSLAGIDAYPRGLGRDTESSITDQCGKLQRNQVKVKVSYGDIFSDSYWTEVEQSAADVHSTSYYLSGMQDIPLKSYDVKKQAYDEISKEIQKAYLTQSGQYLPPNTLF